MDQHAELIRLKQEILYYKAELSKYNKKILDLERAAQKEIMRNKFLQDKRKEWQGEKDSYRRRLEELQNKVLELEVIVEEEQPIPSPIQNMNHAMRDPYGYFNYSVILPTGDEKTLTIYGDFHIINESKVSLDDLIICFKVHPISAVTFSGKISDQNLINRTEGSPVSVDWIYAKEDWKKASLENGEYWVKPIKVTKLESMSLTGMELIIPIDLNMRKVKVEALIYLNKKSSPIPAINKIKIHLL